MSKGLDKELQAHLAEEDEAEVKQKQWFEDYSTLIDVLDVALENEWIDARSDPYNVIKFLKSPWAYQELYEQYVADITENPRA